jgi:hypothetical protein
MKDEQEIANLSAFFEQLCEVSNVSKSAAKGVFDDAQV